MERITYKNKENKCCSDEQKQELINKLYEYEDLDLTPEEIMNKCELCDSIIYDVENMKMDIKNIKEAISYLENYLYTLNM